VGFSDGKEALYGGADRFRAAGFGGCRKGDVVIGIGEEYRDRSAQFASV
jgi:hypothetical protein